MRIRLVRRPGQFGTKPYVAKYGTNLVCVRYRYDRQTWKRYKTVEIIVEETAWMPTYRSDTLVMVKVARTERQIQKQLRVAGATWDPELLLWELPYGECCRIPRTILSADYPAGNND